MQFSQAITRKSASNLALAFVLLPKEKRLGMSALYAFCREVDDVADDETRPLDIRRQELLDWRADVREACGQGTPRFPVNRELQPVIQRYRLSFDLFDELIQGVEMDLDTKAYDSLADLERYCYRVASVVGLLSIEIFEYRSPACRDYAVCLGKALQLTNILRDVRNDAERGRVYLPGDLLRRFRVERSEILEHRYSPRFARLAAHLAGVARDFYRRAREALPPEDRRSMATAELMGAVYWDLLRKLERRGFNVFDSTPRVGKPRKLFLIGRAWLRSSVGAPASAYGAP